MKKKKVLNLLLAILLIPLAGFAQNSSQSYLQDRAEKNLRYVAQSNQVRNLVKIDNAGIHLMDQNHPTRREIAIYWRDVPTFVAQLENLDFYQLNEMIKHKGTNGYIEPIETENFAHYNEMPTDIKDLFVALDPGHFAGSWEEAVLERKYVKMKGADIGLDQDIQFYESELAYMTCLILKKMIVDAGGHVMLSRNYNTSAVGKSFDRWYTEDFKTDLHDALKKGDVSRAKYNELQNAPKFRVFEDFFKFLDFRKRVAAINDFKPNVTLIIHYNAKEGNQRYGDRYHFPSDENYSMAFVPGAFMPGELGKPDQKLDFCRLLLSPDMDKSMRLADLILKKEEEQLKVPRIPDGYLSYVPTSCVKTPYEGVYARNLYMTRAIRGPLVFSESLYQDNIEEAKRLAKKDYKFVDIGGATYTTSSRVYEVAKAHFDALMEWLDENRKYARR